MSCKIWRSRLVRMLIPESLDLGSALPRAAAVPPQGQNSCPTGNDFNTFFEFGEWQIFQQNHVLPLGAVREPARGLVAGKDQHARVRQLAGDVAQNLRAVEVRQHDVEDHKVGRARVFARGRFFRHRTPE